MVLTVRHRCVLRSRWRSLCALRDTLAVVTIHDVSIGALGGGTANLAQYRGQTMLIVNVASKCGLTPQYASLQKLYETYSDRGLVVLGVPCNQFGGQEPGTPREIADFCEINFGITFPITEKVDVYGPGRHELFARLADAPDPDGTAGDIRWNFEKFVVEPAGSVVARFRPLTDPLSPELVTTVERHLPEPGSMPHAARATTPAGTAPAATTPAGAAPALWQPPAEWDSRVAETPVGRRGLLSRWARRPR
jgi:glutathione peroxidase